MVANKQIVYSVSCVLVVILALTAIDHFSLWSHLGILHYNKWFIDYHVIVAATECDAQGINVFLSNPCDLYNRVHVYSRAWFILDDLGLGTDNYLIWGFIFSTLFLATFLITVKPTKLWQFIVMSGFLTSPAIMLGLERANNDLIVFSLLAIACVLVGSNQLWKKALAYLVLSLSAILKFYPVVAFSVYIIATKSKRTFWAITAVTTLATAIFVVMTITDFQQLTLPQAKRWAFGSILLLQIPFPESPYYKISLLIWFLLCGAALFFAKPDSSASNSIFGISQIQFVAGSSVSLFTFITTTNFDYRCIFLMLCVPLLFEQSKDKESVTSAVRTLILMLVILWWEFILKTTEHLVGKQATFVNFVQWFEHLLTWGLMIRLLWILASILKTPLQQLIGLERTYTHN